MKNPMSLIVMNIVATVVTIIFNSLSVALPIGVATTADIANSVPIRFFPATITFSIWGLIYIGWIIFAVYQALPSQRSNPFVRAIGWWYVLGSLGNMGWLLLFQNLQFAISTIPIVFLLVTLGIIYVNLRRVNAKPSTGDIWAIFVPFSIYFAWAAVANVANLTYVLFPGEGELWLGLTQETWAAIMLVIAGGITGVVAYINRDLPYFLVVVWAYLGIIIRYPDIQIVVVTAAAVAALGLLVVFARSFFGRRPMMGAPA